MKIGDLVIMPHREKRHFRRVIGMIVDDKVIRDRVAVVWFDSRTESGYEPTTLLEVISHV